MPCRSDYLEQNSREAELQRAAKLYKYVLETQKKPVPKYVDKAADTYYCTNDKPLLELCSTLSNLRRTNRAEFDRIVYNSRSAQSRDLANWWEAHRAADLKRVLNERAAKKKATLKESALSKLTLAERIALDLESL
jgi:hypothetical protein